MPIASELTSWLAGPEGQERLRVRLDVRLGRRGHVLAAPVVTERLVLAEALGVGCFVFASSIEQVGQQHHVTGLSDALAELEQGRADASAVHVDQHGRPGAFAGIRSEDRGLGLAIVGSELH